MCLPRPPLTNCVGFLSGTVTWPSVTLLAPWRSCTLKQGRPMKPFVASTASPLPVRRLKLVCRRIKTENVSVVRRLLTGDRRRGTTVKWTCVLLQLNGGQMLIISILTSISQQPAPTHSTCRFHHRITCDSCEIKFQTKWLCCHRRKYCHWLVEVRRFLTHLSFVCRETCLLHLFSTTGRYSLTAGLIFLPTRSTTEE